MCQDIADSNKKSQFSQVDPVTGQKPGVGEGSVWPTRRRGIHAVVGRSGGGWDFFLKVNTLHTRTGMIIGT